MKDRGRNGSPDKPISLLYWKKGRTTFAPTSIETDSIFEEPNGDVQVDITVDIGTEKPLNLKGRELVEANIFSKPIRRVLYYDSKLDPEDFNL